MRAIFSTFQNLPHIHKHAQAHTEENTQVTYFFAHFPSLMWGTVLAAHDKQAVSGSVYISSDISEANADEFCTHWRKASRTPNYLGLASRVTSVRHFNATAASPTWSRVAGGLLLLFSADNVAFPRQTGLLGGVPHAVNSWPGLAAGRRAGKGRAAGRGVREDIAEQ